MANITAHWSPGPQVLVEFYSSMLSFLCDCFQSGQSLLLSAFEFPSPCCDLPSCAEFLSTILPTEFMGS